ncbi:lipopolysaccharide biosynthesis protein [Runella salmonicolor]|uniref:MATE family efflux transporter n=1 Tax=Runella salmonicolor TaxID=2950278 RepID=A0ABT1FJT0_9BACT|nr:MATE family efflux transporter [Runella salmonicolor]MCP1382034.1 MATE family efflux transporter [Runella salmonicolor]
MSLTGNHTKKIAKNTLMLYLRQVLVLIVSLFTVRIVLDVLGVEDYGIYNVVGGIVSFFSFLSGSMASATQRFFSFALGQNDLERLKKTFTVNLTIYISIAFIAFILLDTVGLWFVKNYLKLPNERFETILYIYHFSVFTFVATIVTTPLTSIIIAHEDMHIYAYMSILETSLKLCVVFLLVYVDFDKLQLYSILLLVVSLINFTCYFFICIYKYQECQFNKFYWDKNIFREVLGFTGWTLFGQITTVGRNQAITILVNQFFNPITVAARSIAVNITSQINLFSNNFNTGLYPPLIKAYASGNKQEMFALLFNGSKITFFLMWIFALPFYLEMDTILKLWLKEPPEYSVLFTRLALIESVIMSISLPIATAARAPGKMRGYELALGTIQIGIFIASWIILMMGGNAASVFIVAIVANLLMLVVRLIIVGGLIALPLGSFSMKVLLPILLVSIVSITFSYLIKWMLPIGFLFSFINIFFSIIFSSLSMYFIGLDKEMRKKIKEIFENKILKKYKLNPL